jgi:hypothetical protein
LLSFLRIPFCPFLTISPLSQVLGNFVLETTRTSNAYC